MPLMLEHNPFTALPVHVPHSAPGSGYRTKADELRRIAAAMPRKESARYYLRLAQSYDTAAALEEA